MNLIDRTFAAWWTPSAFRNDWRKYAKNQIGHTFGIGFLPALILGWAGVVAVLSLYAIWEWSQWYFRRAEPFDAFEDWGFVLLGSLLGATLDPGYGVAMVTFLVAGILWRRDAS